MIERRNGAIDSIPAFSYLWESRSNRRLSLIRPPVAATGTLSVTYGADM
jgi:hypothetical protein